MSKRMIFHIPLAINKQIHSGSQIRPQRMIEAFRDIGYEVDLVVGYAKTRKIQINKIKSNIDNGILYDFLYSESSTMPTLLTERSHLPIAPFLDFNFLKFCRSKGIKVGLFYRDIHWRFDQYKKGLNPIKRFITTIFYRYDLLQYKKSVDCFYLPSKRMYDYIPFSFANDIKELPPAISLKKNTIVSNSSDCLNFAYVGGLGVAYNLTMFCKVINKMENTTLYLCTRENDWDKNFNLYRDFQNIIVEHKNGDGLKDIFSKAAIGVLFVEPTEYWDFAIAVKLFEYMAYRKPILAVKNTAVGDFIESNKIGWTIDYNENDLKKIITYLRSNPTEVETKINNIENILEYHTWEARANQVVNDLIA